MKRKWDWGSAAMSAMMLLMGMALGFTVIADLNERGEQSLGAHLFSVMWLAMAAALALFGQLILHEGGHLVCGLATGYRFVSFRIGSWMLQREHGKLRVRKFTLAGTGGQCLLAPPPLTDGKMPCVLYNLGGPLANLITALLCVLGMRFCRENWPLWVLLQLFAIVGIGMGLTNGIPLRGSVHNDGANALSLGKDPAALRSLWVQLSVNVQQAESVRLKEMPETWFALPTDAEMQNSMTAVLAVLRENRLMDAHRFDEAAALIDRLNTGAYAVMPLYNHMLLCDRLYCALLRGEDAYKWLAEWETKPIPQADGGLSHRSADGVRCGPPRGGHADSGGLPRSLRSEGFQLPLPGGSAVRAGIDRTICTVIKETVADSFHHGFAVPEGGLQQSFL